MYLQGESPIQSRSTHTFTEGDTKRTGYLIHCTRAHTPARTQATDIEYTPDQMEAQPVSDEPTVVAAASVPIVSAISPTTSAEHDVCRSGFPQWPASLLAWHSLLPINASVYFFLFSSLFSLCVYVWLCNSFYLLALFSLSVSRKPMSSSVSCVVGLCPYLFIRPSPFFLCPPPSLRISSHIKAF